MTKRAYTIGHAASYEAAMREPGGTKKLGRRLPSNEFPKGYAGGWTWETAREATDFKLFHMRDHQPEWDPTRFAVFELELPTGWDQDVAPPETGERFCRLINDSKIVRRVIT